MTKLPYFPHANHLPGKCMTSVVCVKCSLVQDGVHLVNYGAIKNKIDEKVEYT